MFKGKPSLKERLDKEGIKEVNIVGLASHDCVIASAFDAFDNGYLTFVLEEGSSASSQNKHNAAVEVLRAHHMTNNSCLGDTTEIDLI